jgi:hypothetical protein
LALLPNRHRAAAVYKVVSKGGYFKFNRIPPVIRVFRNHPDLRQRTDAVWNTLQEQLNERSAVPFDTCGGLLSGTFLLEGSLPKGLSSIRWVAKKHSSKVRVTMNMSPFKPYFDPEDVAVDLDTNTKLRHRVMEGDLFLGLDQHASFYHYSLAPAHRTYAGFSLHATDFPAGIAAKLARRYPHAILLLGGSKPIGLQRFRRGDYRLVFVMAGLPMGVSPAVAMLSFVMDALVDVWSLFPVGTGLSLELPRVSNYVDDSAFMLSREHPRNGFELVSRMVLEYCLLGFRLNLPKCHLLPTPWLVHLGLRLHATASSGCTFVLTDSRVVNVAKALADLAVLVVVGQLVPLSRVAAVVGTLWSIHAVAHRAVAIMCRSMISVLAVALRVPELRLERDPRRLAALLKRAWRGFGMWTSQAHVELSFWLLVPLHKLRSNMRFDATTSRLRAWVARPDGSLVSDARVLAVDTSDSGSGGAELLRDGLLWLLRPGTSMFVRLRDSEVDTSSTMRELLGVLRLDLSLIPDDCARAIVMCDSQAAVACLLRGSRVPKLNAIVARIFARQLGCGRVLFPVWVRRSEAQIVAVDTLSRTPLGCALFTPPALFRKANAEAVRLWGRGLQLDAFADMHNVVPPGRGTKLPFFSQHRGPHSSGVDAFLQDWRDLIVWVNAPFGLIGRVLSLLRAQSAVAVVVVPVGTRARWSRQIRLGATGVRAFVPYDPNNPHLRMRGSRNGASRYRGKYALVFLDFRVSARPTWRGTPSAEALPVAAPQAAASYLTLPRRACA